MTVTVEEVLEELECVVGELVVAVGVVVLVPFSVVVLLEVVGTTVVWGVIVGLDVFLEGVGVGPKPEQLTLMQVPFPVRVTL